MKIEALVSSLYTGQRPILEKFPKDSIEVTLAGIVGDSHLGFTKPADSRNPEYKRGSEMRNDRQWSAVSTEELSQIAKSMGVQTIDPGWIGANISLSGIENLTQLPKGTKLIFPKDAALLVEAENLPCIGPGKVIASKYPDLNLNPSSFPKAAIGKRGLVGVVERAGIITLRDIVLVKVYEPKAYSLPPKFLNFC